MADSRCCYLDLWRFYFGRSSIHHSAVPSSIFDSRGGRVPKLARFQFLDHASRDFSPDWDVFAQMRASITRAEAGRDPHDRGLQDLVGELSTRSETFRSLWGAHDIRSHCSGVEHFRHLDVGGIVLAHEELAIAAEPGLVLVLHIAEPGSPFSEKLRLPASLAAARATAQRSSCLW